MNLQVNLILDSECRSGGSISKKFIIRVVAIIVPTVLLLIIIPIMFAGRAAKRLQRAAEQEEKKIEPVYKVVMALRDDLDEQQSLYTHIEGWRKSRMDWYEILTGLQTIAPTNVQFTRLTVNETIESVDGLPARKVLMLIKGKVVGKDAKQDAQRLDRDIKERPPFASLLSSVNVRLLGGSGDPDEEDVRIFDMTCDFIPRKIVEKKQRRRKKKAE
ncbi:hypothetical protein ACFLQR_02210 [Verrucomicrobiota bacterium]